MHNHFWFNNFPFILTNVYTYGVNEDLYIYEDNPYATKAFLEHLDINKCNIISCTYLLIIC